MSPLSSLAPAAVVALLLVGCGGELAPGGIPDGDDASNGGPGTSSPSSSTTRALECSMTEIAPFRHGFEDGALPQSGFTINSPSAFTVDDGAPISGDRSLLVTPNQASYIARPIARACAAGLGFKLRASAEFIDRGGSLARIDAGSRRVTLSVEGGYITLVDGDQVRGVILLEPSKTYSIYLRVDLSTMTLLYTASSSDGLAVTSEPAMQPLPVGAPAPDHHLRGDRERSRLPVGPCRQLRHRRARNILSRRTAPERRHAVCARLAVLRAERETV